MTYAEAVDEALCFGWIDGIIKRVDDESYTHRFTPRKPRSIWSLVNINHVARLTAAGKMAAPGIAAYEARLTERSGIYLYERDTEVTFDATQLKRFKANKKAWVFWETLPPGFRRSCTHWVISAKREETREKRLATLIADSAKGVRLAEAMAKKRDADL